MGTRCAAAEGVRSALPAPGRRRDILDGVKGDPPMRRRAARADAGSAARRRTPGRAHDDPSLMLDAAGWSRFADGIDRAADLCRRRDYEPTFHHHGASYVETPQEIGELLDRTDVEIGRASCRERV